MGTAGIYEYTVRRAKDGGEVGIAYHFCCRRSTRDDEAKAEDGEDIRAEFDHCLLFPCVLARVLSGPRLDDL